jgi:hypothetical protein
MGAGGLACASAESRARRVLAWRGVHMDLVAVFGRIDGDRSTLVPLAAWSSRTLMIAFSLPRASHFAKLGRGSPLAVHSFAEGTRDHLRTGRFNREK